MEFYYEENGIKYLAIFQQYYDYADNRSRVPLLEVINADSGEVKNTYEIHVFKIVNDLNIEVDYEILSESLQDQIRASIENIKVFVADPYFDDVMILFGADVYTTQEAFKPYTCMTCGKELYEKRKDTIGKSQYISLIKNELQKDKNDRWPYKGKLQVQFSISNAKNKLEECDIDNFAKTVLDSLNGLVYVDDRQVNCLVVNKEYVLGIKAVVIAIKELEDGERPFFKDFLYSEKENAWKEEHEIKFKKGKSIRFRQYEIGIL